jgi:hypothetical protein
VPLVSHVSHWLTAVIILAALVVAVLEGSYRVWTVTDAEKAAALDSARLTSTPVPRSHGDKLREVARRLRDSLDDGQVPDYGPQDPGMWRRALLEHFPGLEAALEKAAGKDAGFESLQHRLRQEAAAAGTLECCVQGRAEVEVELIRIDGQLDDWGKLLSGVDKLESTS